jgi:hypothetical protein
VREGWGGGSAKRCRDLLCNPGPVAKHVVIPKSQNPESLALEPSAPLGIAVSLQRVLTAIDFNDQLRFKTHKVDDVGTDRLLPAKAMVHDLPTAQQCP